MKLEGSWALEPVKSSTASPLAASTLALTTISPPPSIGTRAAPSLQHADRAAHAGLGVGLHEAHVARDLRRAVLGRSSRGTAAAPAWQAAIWAFRSAMLRSGARAGHWPGGQRRAGLGLQEARRRA